MRLQLDTFASNSFNSTAKVHSINNINDYDDDGSDAYYNQHNNNNKNYSSNPEEDEIGGSNNVNYSNTHRDVARHGNRQ